MDKVKIKCSNPTCMNPTNGRRKTCSDKCAAHVRDLAKRASAAYIDHKYYVKQQYKQHGRTN